MRRAVGRLLRGAGFEVGEAENGRVALEVEAAARDAGRPFDAFVIDLSMPVMGGRRLLAELGARGVDAAVVVHTGVLAPDIEPLVDAVLLKPVEAPRLVACVERVLAARRSPAAAR